MSTLAKATLQEIKSNRVGEPVGEALDVQFNPATLQVKLSNTIEGGDSKKRQTRQYIGESSTSLSFDLVFDTAEETDGSQNPVSVRTRTELVEKFLAPKKDGNKEVPPKVRFHWGKLIFDGIISSLNIDFELFAPDGTPLRAKMGVTIDEQDPEYQFLESGPGAFTDAGSSGGDTLSAGSPGSSGTSSADRTAQALEGESAADFAARMGLDPSKWRSLVPDGVDALSLPAGLEIDFDSSLTLSAGLSAKVGIEADVGVSLGSSLGLETGSRGGSAEAFALTEAGGVSAGLAALDKERTEEAAAGAARAFDATGGSSASTPTSSPSAGSSSKAPAAAGAPASTAASTASLLSRPAAPAQPAWTPVDARATGYGFGVPLKPRSRPDEAEPAPRGVVQGAGSGAPREGRDGRRTPWAVLPAGDPGRKAADQAQALLRPPRSCGCRGPCAHRGGRG